MCDINRICPPPASRTFLVFDGPDLIWQNNSGAYQYCTQRRHVEFGNANSVTLELLVGGRVTIWARRAPRVSQFSLDTHASHLSWAGMSYLNHLLFSEELMVSVKCSQRSVSMTFPFTTGGWDFRSKKHWHLLYLNNQMRMKWSYLSRQKGIATQVLTQHWSSLDISLTAGIQGSVKDKHCFWKRYDHCYSSHIQRNAIHLGKTIFRL